MTLTIKDRRNIVYLILAILADVISRYCWSDSVFVYYFFKEVSTSLLLYILLVNLDGISKIIVCSLFVLSLYEMIDEVLGFGAVVTWPKELVMLIIGILTIWKIRKALRKS